jgi:hypothetical protein
MLDTRFSESDPERTSALIVNRCCDGKVLALKLGADVVLMFSVT